ncbi:MAG: hypothetical protein JSW51_11850 [Gemmatimonadota bacterium]|nr:MAG: hypothetical protein JSW51_11850 [Gemmatimonadota bacterium]
MISIPVKFHTPDAMFTEAEGLVRFEDGRLVLEFETKDAFFGAYRSGVQELEIFPDDVAAVRYKPTLFKTELAIRARTMKKFESVPGNKLGEVKLRFKRRHRAEAEELASFLQHRLNELEVEQPDELMDEITAED